MIEIAPIELVNGTAVGIRIAVETGHLLIIKAKKGFVMCGALDIDAVEKAGEAAVRVRGVDTFKDVLEARIEALTSKARDLGISEGMTGKASLEKMM